MYQTRDNLLLILTLLTSSIAFALPTDSKETLHVKADNADINQETRKGIFISHVELDQGTTHLRAAKAVTIVNEKNQLTSAIADGDGKNQAHFWTTTDPEKPPLHAYANSISYSPATHVVELNGNAHVEQGTDSFSAPLIRYDTKEQHVISKSDGIKQTVIVFHPKNHHSGKHL